MKKLFTLLTAVLITASVLAQSPEKMSYQSVIRNASDQLLTNQDMGMQISILQGSASGTPVYVETHSTTSNANGLVTIEIGTGTTSDDFSAIDWANDIFFIKTETDPTTAGGTAYTITGTSQLLSVPYALHAKTAGTADYNNLTNLPALNIANWDNAYSWDDHSTAGYLTSYIETDPVFSNLFSFTSPADNQLLKYNSGTTVWENWTPNFLTTEVDGDASNEIQNLSDVLTEGSDAGNNEIGNVSKIGIGTSAPGAQLHLKSIQDVEIFLEADTNNITETDNPIIKISQDNGLTVGGWGFDANNEMFLTSYSTTPHGFYISTDSIARFSIDSSGIIDVKNNNITNLAEPVNDQDAATKAYVDATGATTLAIGDSYGGGIIFYLDASGQHGLIAATADQSTGLQWYNGSNIITGATLDAVYAGKANTELIISVQGAGSYAAQLCDDYSITINNEYYSDWYLPSKYELNLLYGQKDIVGGFSNDTYWSSTEFDNNYAWSQYFVSGEQGNTIKYGIIYVRAVRAF